MRNFVLTLLFTFFLVASYAQNNCEFYTNKSVNNPIVLNGTVKLENMSKNEVFNKIASWGSIKIPATNGPFTSDRESGIIKGVMRINYVYKKGFRFILYNIILQADEGGFSYTFNSFLMNKKPMEQYLRDKKNDSYYNKSFEDICAKIKDTIKELQEIK